MVSACLIVRDEAALLAPCLRSLRGHVDEVVVVDTGSSDATRDIARAAGAEVLDVPWTGSFAAARNAAAGYATGELILTIDADERLVPPARPLAEVAAGLDAVYVQLHNVRSQTVDPARVPDAPERMGPPVWVPRLFRRTSDLRWEGRAHEMPVSFLRRRRDRLGQADVHLVHLGYVPELWEARDKGARNRALLRQQCIETPRDRRALVLLARNHLRAGRLGRAGAAAERAWALAVEEAARSGEAPWDAFEVAVTVLRIRVRQGAFERMAQVLGVLDGWMASTPSLAAQRDHPNLRYLEALHHEVAAIHEPSSQQRLEHLLRAGRCHWTALQRVHLPAAFPVLPTITEAELRARHQLVVHQLGQRGFARDALPELELDPPHERMLRAAELDIAEGRAEDCAASLLALARSSGDPEAWIVAGAAARALGRRAEVATCVAAAKGGDPTYRAGHRARLLADLDAWCAAGAGLDRAVFVGGAGRSGTTLLRAMLNAHPRLYAGPEVKLLPETGAFVERISSFRSSLSDAGVEVEALTPAFVPFVRAIVASLPSGGLRPVEKTPANVMYMEHLARCFPGACFLHILRDGRDVVASLLEQDWANPSTGEPLPMCSEPQAAASYWRETILRARCQAAWLLGRVLEIRYEALVADPEGVMRRVLAFLGEPWAPEVLDHAAAPGRYPPSESSSETASRPVFATSVGRWRTTLAPKALAVVEATAGDLLEELGYAGPVHAEERHPHIPARRVSP